MSLPYTRLPLARGMACLSYSFAWLTLTCRERLNDLWSDWLHLILAYQNFALKTQERKYNIFILYEHCPLNIDSKW